MSTATVFTRRDLAGYVAESFDCGALGRDEVVGELVRHEAPAELVDLVGDRIPEGTRLADLRALWHYLGDLPVDRDAR